MKLDAKRSQKVKQLENIYDKMSFLQKLKFDSMFPFLIFKPLFVIVGAFLMLKHLNEKPIFYSDLQKLTTLNNFLCVMYIITICIKQFNIKNLNKDSCSASITIKHHMRRL